MRTPPDTASESAAEAEHVRARIAWYYYAGGLTQQEIADRLGVTRLRVNRIVGQLRSDGAVRIDVNLPLAACVALEERLVARFGLVEAHVVPTIDDGEVQQRMIGEAAGKLIDGLMSDGVGFGVGWGRTLSAATRRITTDRVGKGYVATLMGGLTRGSGINTFEVSTEFARVLGAECYYLAAPIYCPSREIRDELLAHYGLAEAMRRARTATVALVACGDLTARSLLASTHIVSEHSADLRARGAVGDLLGVFLDATGAPIDHPLNRRVMSLALDDLRAIPDTVLASGGWAKREIVGAVLAGGYVKRVVTDEACAKAVLGDEP